MTQPKKERRERAAKRLVAQLEAGTKPERLYGVQASGSSRGWRTAALMVPLTDVDRARIQRELIVLQN